MSAACARRAEMTPIPDASRLGEAIRFLDSAVAVGAAPGAVLAVSAAGRRFYHATGRLGTDDATAPDSATVYDLASLTKVVGLTTAVMLAVDEERLDIDAPVSRYVPAFRGGAKDGVTLRHLLTHSSGLPAWRPLYREAIDRGSAMALADTTPLDTTPGRRMVYSDLGAIILTQAVEGAFGRRLDSLLAERVFGPLGMESTRFLPPADWLPRIAPTELDPWRGRVLRGEVHDENASRLDGVSGHAGLFASAEDLMRFGEWLLAGTGGGSDTGHFPVAPPASAQRFVKRQDLPPETSRALGWDTPSEGSSAGRLVSRESFGHTGFTGTSIWIDPVRDLVIVLLSNRVHPTRDNERWGPVRRNVADRVVRGLFGE
jgi:CubicO group peptidase (beta-lactamase class C family)